MRAEHIQRSRVGSCSAALPTWAAGKFTDGQAAVMRAVGIEMLNKRGPPAITSIYGPLAIRGRGRGSRPRNFSR